MEGAYIVPKQEQSLLPLVTLVRLYSNPFTSASSIYSEYFIPVSLTPQI